jgi:hypothetical protein
LNSFETTEVTVRILGPSDPIPTAESYLGGYLPTDEEGEDPIQPATGNGGGVRQSKRLRLGKNRKKKVKIEISKTMDVRSIQMKASSAPSSRAFTDQNPDRDDDQYTQIPSEPLLSRATTPQS